MNASRKTLARNIYVQELRTRAANASVEVHLDTRPKIIAPKKGHKSYRRCKTKPWQETGSTTRSP